MNVNPEKNHEAVKNSRNLRCVDIANAIKSLMGMANLSGWIKQEPGTLYRQFIVSSVDENPDNAVLRLQIADQKFKLEITCDSKTISDKKRGK